MSILRLRMPENRTHWAIFLHPLLSKDARDMRKSDYVAFSRAMRGNEIWFHFSRHELVWTRGIEACATVGEETNQSKVMTKLVGSCGKLIACTRMKSEQAPSGEMTLLRVHAVRAQRARTAAHVHDNK